jgi:hypothetical protein
VYFITHPGGSTMTLKNVKPATINSTKLFVSALVALGIAALAYQTIDYPPAESDPEPRPMMREKREPLPQRSIASAIAWAGGISLLVLCNRKR